MHSLLSIVQSHAKFLAFILVLIATISACSDDGIDQNRLKGNWIVVSAARDGRVTTTLEDGFFNFESDSLFRTNIFSEEKAYPYETTTNGFRQLGDELIEYEVLESDPDSLILATSIRNYEFIFITIRDTLPANIPEQ